MMLVMMVMMVIIIAMIKIQDNKNARSKIWNLRYLFQGGKK